VASRIGVLPDYIEDGVNGFLARRDEWVGKLSSLIEDHRLRRAHRPPAADGRERYSAVNLGAREFERCWKQ